MKKLIGYTLLILTTQLSFGQFTTITPGGAELRNKNASEVLKMPKLSNQNILAITNPVSGSFVFDTDYNCIRIFNGSEWTCLSESQNIPFKLKNKISTKIIAGSESSPNTRVSLSISSIVFDTQNNFYVAGSIYKCYSGGIGCGSYGGSSPLQAHSTGIIMKFSSNGAFKWSTIVQGKPVNGSQVDANFSSEVSDMVLRDNKLYVIGNYTTGILWQTIEVISNGGRDSFVSKVETSGTLNWIKKIGGSLDDIGNSIKLDDNGYVFVTGSYKSSPLTIGTSPNSIVLNNKGGSDIFLGKFDTNGIIQNAVSFGGTNDDSPSNLIYESPYFYVTGTFKGNFAAGSTSFISAGGIDTFVSEFNSLLTFSGSNRFGGTTINDEISPTEIKKINGRIFLSGKFKGNILLGDKTLISTEYNSFITSFYFSSTSIYINYLQTITSSDGFLSIAPNNNAVYIVGNYKNMNSTLNIPLQSKGSTDIALYELKLDGSYSYSDYIFSGYETFGNIQWEGVRKIVQNNGKVYFIGVGPDSYNPNIEYIYLWSY
jgi:hypothetical protein